MAGDTVNSTKIKLYVFFFKFFYLNRILILFTTLKKDYPIRSVMTCGAAKIPANADITRARLILTQGSGSYNVDARAFKFC